MGATSCLDFKQQIEDNEDYYKILWDYCTCIGCHPSDIVYPGMKDSIIKHTFDMLVHDHARPEQMKLQIEMSGLGTIKKLM